MQDGEVAQDHIATIPQRDHLVAAAGPAVLIPFLALRLVGESVEAAVQAFAMNPAGTEDGHILQPNAPDEAVLPVAVAVVLVVELVAPLVRLGQVVQGPRGIDGFDRGPRLEPQRDVAFQPDRRGEVGAGWKEHGATTGCGCRQDGPVDCVSINRPAVACGTLGPDVENAGDSRLGPRDNAARECND